MNNSIMSKTPDAIEFNSSMQTESGRKAKLGDPERVNSQVSGYVLSAHNALKEGQATIARLAEDETRTAPLKHEAARTVTLRTVASIEAAQRSIVSAAEDFETQAEDMIADRFAPDATRSHWEMRIAEWIAETAKAKDGLQRIREAMKQDPEIVSVLKHSKSYILGLAPKVRDGLYIDGIEMHLPEAVKLANDGLKLRDTADKYSRVTKGIRSSWFNKAIAEKAKSRVEV